MIGFCLLCQPFQLISMHASLFYFANVLVNSFQVYFTYVNTSGSFVIILLFLLYSEERYGGLNRQFCRIIMLLIINFH